MKWHDHDDDDADDADDADDVGKWEQSP